MRVFAGIPRRAAANCRREKGEGAAMIRRRVVESYQPDGLEENSRTSVTEGNRSKNVADGAKATPVARRPSPA